MKSRRSWLQLLFLTLPWALVNGACVRLNEPTFLCESDADCEGSQKCYASHCQAKDYCRSSLDCGELEECSYSDSKCVPIECRDEDGLDAACGLYRCNYESCFPSCDDNSECKDDAHCDFGKCVAGALAQNDDACTTADECRSGKCCPAGDGKVCARACDDGKACSSGRDCLTGFCCKRGAATGSICSVDPCPECVDNYGCGSGQMCEANKCVKIQLADGKSCKSSDECKSGLCRDKVCTPLGTDGSLCTGDEECGGTRHCCDTSIDADSKRCSTEAGSCLSTIGGKCETKADCSNPGAICDRGACSRTCTFHEDCGMTPAGLPNKCASLGGETSRCKPGCNTQTSCSRYSKGAFCSNSNWCYSL